MPRRQTFGPYELAERIGVGALGEVYRAVSRRDGKVVALKRLLSSSSDDFDVIDGLQHEAALVRSLDHPGIAKVVDIGEVDRSHFIAYAFVDGRDVRAIRERAQGQDLGRVPLAVALSIGVRVLEALEYAHTKTGDDGRPLDLVHRDVSPPNLLVGFDGSVTLLDFGIARVAGRSLRTGQGQVKGTLGYMSPEQVAGDPVDARSDLYSLAVCLWELVTGRRLFDGTRTLEVAQRIAKGEVPSARRVANTVPERLDRALAKALAQSPAERYPTASAFRDELLQVARDETLTLDTTRVAQYVRSLFPEVAAAGAAPFEELVNMAENKGGSDLDVFEGLAKKSARPAASVPGLAPPPPSVPPLRKGTMVGLGAIPPLPPPGPPSKSLPPSPPSLSKPPPPPASKAPPLPPAAAASTPLPVPSGGSRPSLPAVSAPPPSRASGSMPAASSKSPSLPPPTITPLPPPPLSPPVSAAASSLPAPLPPPPKNGASAKTQAAVDMDWDDDEESTHVYDKDGGSAMPDNAGPRPAAGAPAAPKVNNAAAALLAGSGGTAKVSAPPPPPPIPAMIPQASQPRAQIRDHRDQGPISDRNRGEEETAVRPRPQPSRGSGSSKVGIILGALSLFVVVGLAIFLLLPKKGQLKIDIKGKGGEAIAKAEIFVDGVKKCDTTPCLVADLEQGSRALKVIAPGLPVIERSETVEAGKEKLVSLEVDTGAATGAATAAAATAPAADANVIVLKVAGTSTQPQVKVSIDGADKGTLPIELKGLTAGEHKVKFEGGDRLEKREETVTLANGQTKDMGAVKLKVLKGQVTLSLETKGADVKLVRHDGSKKVEKKLPDSVWSSPPVRIDINPSENWKLVASKKGREDFSQLLDFEDGQAEKTIEIKLEEAGKAAPVAAGPGPGPRAAKEPVEKSEKADKPEKASGGGGEGTINMNAIPVSKVLLDGRPMGTTPKLGVSVPAGSHTVTFINPDGGRKTVTVQVKGGETKTAAVKF